MVDTLSDAPATVERRRLSMTIDPGVYERLEALVRDDPIRFRHVSQAAEIAIVDFLRRQRKRAGDA